MPPAPKIRRREVKAVPRTLRELTEGFNKVEGLHGKVLREALRRTVAVDFGCIGEEKVSFGILMSLFRRVEELEGEVQTVARELFERPRLPPEAFQAARNVLFEIVDVVSFVQVQSLSDVPVRRGRSSSTSLEETLW